MKTIIKTEALRFKDILTYPNIEIEKTKATFIKGESGCGKSTLLKLFNATLSPSHGEIFFNGENIEKLDTIKLRQDVLLACQVPFLFKTSIFENFVSYHNYRKNNPPSEAEAADYLRICKADFPLNKDAQIMSGGERQRVYIAIFLSLLPKVLMLDEPSSALNTEMGLEVIGNVLSFCKQKQITPIIVSHNDELTKSLAEDVVELKKGVQPCRT